MPHSENELLAARLARIKVMIDSLELACSESAQQRDTFTKIREEMAAAREALKVHPSPSE